MQDLPLRFYGVGTLCRLQFLFREQGWEVCVCVCTIKKWIEQNELFSFSLRDRLAREVKQGRDDVGCDYGKRQWTTHTTVYYHRRTNVKGNCQIDERWGVRFLLLPIRFRIYYQLFIVDLPQVYFWSRSLTKIRVSPRLKEKLVPFDSFDWEAKNYVPRGTQIKIGAILLYHINIQYSTILLLHSLDYHTIIWTGTSTTRNTKQIRQ